MGLSLKDWFLELVRCIHHRSVLVETHLTITVDNAGNQILMLSGVGPADHLAEHRIPLVADLPGVGQHLQDHLVLDLHYKDTDKLSLSYLLDQGFYARLRVMSNIWQFRMSGSGPLTTNVSVNVTFFELCY